MARAAERPPEPEPQAEAEAEGEPVTGVADPEQAWKALTLVNDWIKHAEAKTGASLAVAGVTGGVLYNLVKDQHDPGPVLWAAAVVCGVAVLAAGLAAARALMPRLRLSRTEEEPVSRLFFSHIARKYEYDGLSYVEVLRTLTGQPEELTREIAHQVHANAVVAHRKFFWADWAVRALVVALAALGVVAAIVGSE
jgi:hypothetical protein